MIVNRFRRIQLIPESVSRILWITEGTYFPWKYWRSIPCKLLMESIWIYFWNLQLTLTLKSNQAIIFKITKCNTPSVQIGRRWWWEFPEQYNNFPIIFPPKHIYVHLSNYYRGMNASNFVYSFPQSLQYFCSSAYKVVFICCTKGR